MADIIYYIVLYSVLGMACIVLCAIFYTIISALWEDRKWKKLIREWEDDKMCLIDQHFSEDPIGIGDPHSDTIEKSFTKNDFRYSDEQFVYIFKDGLKETRSSPYNHLELLELVKKHGSCELEVVKL